VRVAVQSFGGPAGQIAVMHRILVEEKRWVSESRFLHALNYCMLLPGPEAQQLAIYIGWLLHRTLGGLVAGVLFVLPGFLSILALSLLYAGYHQTDLVQALFYGLKPAVMAVVVEAVFRIGKRALKNGFAVALAVAAFVAIFFFDVPFPLIVSAAGIAGWAADGAPAELPANDADADMPIADSQAARVRPSLARSLRVLAVWLAVWLVPLAAVGVTFGRGHILWREGVFFSKMAVVTFGGAYAVLAYIGQQAVGTYHWVTPGEMLDGLGMAETTPGPLIQVVQFVGFLGAWRNPGSLSPVAAGLLGSLVTAWSTFAPCFLWIFLGAPYIEALRGRRGLTAALAGITAAVVGVIFNLAVWFSLHTLFARVTEVHRFGARWLIPAWSTLDPAALVIAAGAFLALFRLKLGMMKTLAASAVAGLIWYMMMLA
jgi:chromate transporter